MLVAQNPCIMTGNPHPGYRGYDTDRGVGPPVGSLGSGGGGGLASIQPPHHERSSNSSVPTFSLPPSGVPYTGPFPVPTNNTTAANYHQSMGPFSVGSQNTASMSNGLGAGGPQGNGSSSTPAGYQSEMGYSPLNHQHPQSQMMDPYDHFMVPGCQYYPGSQYSTYGTPSEASPSSRYQRSGSNRQLSSTLPTIFEDCQEVNRKYGGYMHSSTDVPRQHSGQTCIPPPEVEQQHVVPTKIEPEWWHDSDIGLLTRIQQIRLHSDNSPSRDRTPPRRKRRNSEKRKEKSRDAARCRRGKESEIFTELANALPLPAQTIAQLDKASVMRLTIAFLKTRSLFKDGLTKKSEGTNENGAKLDVEMDALHLRALDGFALVLSTDGDVIYASENIANFLGLLQVDVMGQCLLDYTHPCDHDEVRELVSAKGSQEPRHAFLRLKCTLTAKGRSVNLKSASYKVVQVSGELVRGEEDEAWFVALGTPVPHPSNIEFPLDKQTFVSKHSLDMKFTYVDDNVGEFCGYAGDELIGRSLYEMHHALDSDLIKDAFKTLRSKGQVETGRYRFLARGGGYVWLVTQATIIPGPKDNPKPQYVVCLNYVVSGVESPGEVLSELQLVCSKNSSGSSSNNSSNIKPCSKPLPSSSTSVPVVACSPTVPAVPHIKAETQPKVPRVAPAPPPPTPVASTFKIFTHRTEEMNKGYVTFSEDDPTGIVLKDEPDDLTHLAPSGGDTCVPLEVPTFIPEWDDMLSLDYKQIPISSADVLFASPTAVSGNPVEQGSSPKYDEYEVTGDGTKIPHRFSVGKVAANLGGSISPPSNCSSPASAGFRTPEPPKPLLSQASLFQSSPGSKPSFKGVVESSRPRTTTESLFTHLDEITSVGDGYNKLEIKLEDENMDEFFLRAPYIPLSNESLMLSQDDLMWGAQLDPVISPNTHPPNKRDAKYLYITQEDEDSSLAQLLRDGDPPIAGPNCEKSIPTENASGPHRSQYQQSKFLDGGGSFVDPNKVLPGHFGSKDGIDDSPGSGIVEEDPPQVMMHEQVEPPPPLIAIDSRHLSLQGKRRHSPTASPRPSHKKLCPILYDPQQQQQQQRFLQQNREGLLVHQQQQHQQQHHVPQVQTQHSGVRELTTPYAPTMQQLLISKEPIIVRGGRPGGGISTPLNIHKGKDSVLRNLLVSGRDESAGYSVSAPPSPASSTSTRNTTLSPGSHIISVETSGGGKDLTSNGDECSDAGDLKQLAAASTLRIPQEQMTAMLLADGGSINASPQLSYPKLRIFTGSQDSVMQANHQFQKMASGSVMGGGGGLGSEECISGEGLMKRGRRQDPLLLMDPDLSIKNLLDLSQFDCEVNAPTSNSDILQGADLLMALDQSL